MPYGRGCGAHRDRAPSRDGQRNVLASRAQTSASCGCPGARGEQEREHSPRARVTSRWATIRVPLNLMDQSGKNPRHGQEEDWQFIGSTGCGRL